MNYKEQEDVYYHAAKEAGISKTHLKFIVKSFWSGVRSYLTNPLNTKKGILINGFGSFFINPYTLERKVKTLEKNKASQEKINFNKELLKQIKECK